MTMTDCRRTAYLRAALAAVLILGLILFFALDGDRWLSLETLRENRDRLQGFTQAHYAWALLLCFVVYLLSTALSIPGGAVLSLTMGLLFGRWVGTLITVAASTLGATVVFLAARFVLFDAVQRHLSRLPMAARLIAGFQQDAFHYLLFLRLVPIFPFWLVNLVPSVTAVSTRTYFRATLIGVIPGSFVYVNLGQALGEIRDAADLLSAQVLLSFSLLGFFALLPVLLRRSGGGC